MSSAPLNWQDLHLSPVAIDLGFAVIRWYALSYIAMIGLGWAYLRRLVAQPGAPMTTDQVDDLVSYAAFGIILGGRLGYSIFYQPSMWLDPVNVLKVWQGGMSFHGGLIGLLTALLVFARRNGLSMVRICDYVGCATPFGLVLVRLANFANGELWGKPTTVPWGMVFPQAGDGLPRHPSQLYEAVLEGVVMMVVLGLLFWRSDARWKPGRLLGAGLVTYALARGLSELFRQPDAGLEHLPWGLSMGQTLSVPMLVAGLCLLVHSARSDQVAALPA
jgi:phosphatidylglycerol:prolipoprotein diacylglycerol transferase